MRYLRLIIGVSVLALLALLSLYFYRQLHPSDNIEVGSGKIVNLETMAQLCVTDIYAEVPVLDTVGDKVMFAIQKQRGSISFDLEKMKIDTVGDTIRVELPPETINLYESTDKDSWQVVDTKAIGPMAMLRSDKFSLEEENLVKRRIRNKSIKRLYQNGTVERARLQAIATITPLLENIYRKPTVVK